ncbi:MAG: bifunctional precorrin-2 dehydrogenase/sirohydrochlorin ferrochelatase, partial [Phaeodactylibacter sp.]|nr:bifunctional precorrin-2 dehydrogenase/sirohydrochlorin ferrochelatase [Phaeodactylibacter sp.]
LPPVAELLEHYPGIDLTIIKKDFEPSDTVGFDLVVAATNFEGLNREVRDAAKQNGALVNVADTPALCDFYLGSIVTRGSLKVAISTNGQSPTFAKRFRQWLEAILPEETDALLGHLKVFRDQLKGDFETKVKELNDLTASLVKERQNN